MELRHLRYFVAVAEEGSLINAAERRLHTAQPSLSRQIRDLELEGGGKLLERRARGMSLRRLCRLDGRADSGELIGCQRLLREQQAGAFLEIGMARAQ